MYTGLNQKEFVILTDKTIKGSLVKQKRKERRKESR